MDKNRLNISAIETFFYGLLNNKLSEHTSVGLAQTFEEGWEEMVVIDCATAIEDFNAYGKGTVLLYLYAKPLMSGRKNVAVFDRMEKKLNEIISENRDKHYVISRRNTFCDYDEVNKAYFNVVEVNLQIL